MSLWALAPSPLMLGMNLTDNDDWTTAIISNPEVLAVNQDSAGLPAKRRYGSEPHGEVWVKELADGALAVGFFNRTDAPVKVNFSWRNFGFSEAVNVRDLWLRHDLGRANSFHETISAHGCYLLQVEK